MMVAAWGVLVSLSALFLFSLFHENHWCRLGRKYGQMRLWARHDTPEVLCLRSSTTEQWLGGNGGSWAFLNPFGNEGYSIHFLLGSGTTYLG